MTREYHPICLLFPRMTEEERAELKKDMLDRASNGLDPLEHPVLLYDDKILDGRHRYEVWTELAEESACNGFFGRNAPPTDQFTASKHGTLGAWMKAKSANLVHRHVPAEQKAAIFLKAVDEFPELKAVIEEIKEENSSRQKAGKPVADSDPRGTTAEKVAKLAGVGSTTVKAVQKVKKEAPEIFEQIAQGKTTAKQALKEVKKTPRLSKSKAAPAKPKEIKAGDSVFQIVVPAEWSAVPSVAQRTIKTLAAKNYICADGRRLKKIEQFFLSQDDANKAWRAVMEAQIDKLKDAVKVGPVIAKSK